MRMYMRVPYINIYGVGFGVAVCYEGNYQSLDEWNGKIGSPAFIIKKAISGTSILEAPLFRMSNDL